MHVCVWVVDDRAASKALKKKKKKTLSSDTKTAPAQTTNDNDNKMTTTSDNISTPPEPLTLLFFFFFSVFEAAPSQAALARSWCPRANDNDNKMTPTSDNVSISPEPLTPYLHATCMCLCEQIAADGDIPQHPSARIGGAQHEHGDIYIIGFAAWVVFWSIVLSLTLFVRILTPSKGTFTLRSGSLDGRRRQLNLTTR